MSYSPLNIIRGFLEIWLQMIFLLTLKSMFSVNQGVRKTRDLVGYVKVNWKPLRQHRRSVRPQINPHNYLPVYHMPEKGVLTRTYFCRGSSSRLPSMSHAHKNKLLTCGDLGINRKNSQPDIDSSAAWYKMYKCVTTHKAPRIHPVKIKKKKNRIKNLLVRSLKNGSHKRA